MPGFGAIAVPDGASGILEATRGVHLILLDLGLPDMDGLEVMDRIRDGGLEPPVVVLSAREAIADELTPLGHRPDAYITKPFRFDDLVERIRRLG